MRIDHLAVSGGTRDAGAAHVTAALGVPLQTGGAHPHYGTHNHLLGLEDGLYLEAIAVDPDAQAPVGPRWFGLDTAPQTPRLGHWICRVDDIEAAVAALPMAGAITALARGDLRWRMAQPASGEIAFDGMFPALIQWDGPDPAGALTQRGVALETLHVQHPEAARLEALLAPHLADPRVRFAQGRPGLTALMRTPGGPKVLR
jgi:hypothetical protein